MLRPCSSRLAVRVILAAIVFVSGLAAGLACGSPSSNQGTDRLTTVVTTNGQITTIVTGP